MRRWPLLIVFGPAAIAAAVLTGATLGSWSPADRAGYFKSPDGDRVVAYTAPADLTEAEARDILDAAPSTPGRTTVAVIYAGDSIAPRQFLDRATGLPDAMAIVGRSPFDGWAFRLRVNPAGQRTYD